MKLTSIASPSKKLEPHPLSKIMPPMSDEEMQALTQDIAQRGVLNPITIYEGKILDGNHRYQVAATFEFKKPVGFIQFEGTEVEAKAFVVSANLHRRHLSPEKRREIIAALLRADPNQSNRQIAETTKADHKTVGAVREGMEATGEIPQLETTTGKDGKKRKKKSAKTSDPDPVRSVVSHRESLMDALIKLSEVSSVGHAMEHVGLVRERLIQVLDQIEPEEKAA
jgi:hypothetical protein